MSRETDDAPYVCGGCLAVGAEPHASYCPDARIEARLHGDPEGMTDEEDDEEEDEWTARERERLAADGVDLPAPTVARLDFSARPPSWPKTAHLNWLPLGDVARAREWEKHAELYDPPGMTHRLGRVAGDDAAPGWGFSWGTRVRGRYSTREETRAPAWAHYRRVLALVDRIEMSGWTWSIGAVLQQTPPASGPLWPRALDLSDEQLAELEEALRA